MTVVNPVSGCVGAVEVDAMLEQQRACLLLKKELVLTTVDGSSLRSCTQKLADSDEQETEGTSQLILMTLVKASGSQPRTGQ